MPPLLPPFQRHWLHLMSVLCIISDFSSKMRDIKVRIWEINTFMRHMNYHKFLFIFAADGVEHILPQAHLHLSGVPPSQLVSYSPGGNHHCTHSEVCSNLKILEPLYNQNWFIINTHSGLELIQKSISTSCDFFKIFSTELLFGHVKNVQHFLKPYVLNS